MLMKKLFYQKKKPIINKEQTSKKITNYLIPLEKPTFKTEKTEPKKDKKINCKWRNYTKEQTSSC